MRRNALLILLSLSIAINVASLVACEKSKPLARKLCLPVVLKFDAAVHAIYGGVSSTIPFNGLYTSMDTCEEGNLPPSLDGSATAISSGGFLYLFGGYGYNETGQLSSSSTLYKYEGDCWRILFRTSEKYSYYDEVRVFNSTYHPGYRTQSQMGVDSFGYIWIYGGYGYNKTHLGSLSDLWVFNGSQWLFAAGPDLINYEGSYFAQGVPSSFNFPPSKYGGAMWIDDNSDIWLFGGSDTATYHNDVWKYDWSDWTYVRGGKNEQTVNGTVIENNTPGGRMYFHYAVLNYELYLYGGHGLTATCCGVTKLNELWKYSATGWTLLSGHVDPTASNAPLYTYTLGVPCGECTPGMRSGGFMQVNSGSSIIVGFGKYISANLRDIWEFNGNEWTWIAGYNDGNTTGQYYLPVGRADDSGLMMPNGRELMAYWGDSDGNIWIYGGSGSSGEIYADLWVFAKCSNLYSANVTYYQGASYETDICGVRSDITSYCKTMVNALALASTCQGGVHVTSWVDFSLESIPIEFTNANPVVFYPKYNSTYYDFTTVPRGSLVFDFQNGAEIDFYLSNFDLKCNETQMKVTNATVEFDTCEMFNWEVDYDTEESKVIAVSGIASMVTFSNSHVYYFYHYNKQIFLEVHEGTIVLANSYFERLVTYSRSIFHLSKKAKLEINDTVVYKMSGPFASSLGASVIKVGGCWFEEYSSVPGFFYLSGASILDVENTNVTSSEQLIEAKEKSEINVRGSIFKNMDSSRAVVADLDQCTLNILDCQFETLVVAGWGGIVEAIESDIVFANSTIYDLFALRGGIAQLRDFCTLVVEDVVAEYVTSAVGGLVNVQDYSDATLNRVTVTEINCEYGGIVYVDEHGSVQISDSVFDSVSASNDGALLYVTDNAEARLINSNASNFEAKSGAGVYVDVSGDFYSEGNRYSDFEAEYEGGFAFSRGEFLSVNDTFERCIGEHGGVFGAWLGSIIVVGATVSDGIAYEGGIAYLDGSTLDISASVFKSSWAYDGGAIYAYDNSTVTITGSRIENNQAIYDGGAAYILKSEVVIAHSNISGNLADGTGGALFASKSDTSLSDCIFLNNSADYGGAFFLDDSDTSVENLLEMDSCVFESNSAESGGGAIFSVLNSGPFNSSFSKNVAPYGPCYATPTRDLVVPAEVSANSGMGDLKVNVSVIDVYGQIVSDYQSREVELSSTIQLVGTTIEEVYNGTAVFDEAGVLKTPGSVGILSVKLKERAYYGDMYFDKSLSEDLSIRVYNCSDRQIIDNDQCDSCPFGQYIVPGSGTCTVCQSDATCNGTFLDADEGYWAKTATEEIVLYKCPLNGACPGGLDPTECHEGYHGVVCGVCDAGYGKVGKTCAACGNEVVHVITLPILIAVVVSILLAVAFFVSVRGRTEGGAAIKILFNYGQTVAVIAGLITLKKRQIGTDEVIGVLSAFTLDLNIITVSCLVPLNSYGVMILLTLLTLVIVTIPWLFWAPVFLVGVVIGASGLFLLKLGRKETSFLTKCGRSIMMAGWRMICFSNRLRNIFGLLLYMIILPRFAGHVVSLFACTEISGEYFLLSDFSVKCGTSVYFTFAFFASVMFVVFVIGSQLMIVVGMILIRGAEVFDRKRTVLGGKRLGDVEEEKDVEEEEAKNSMKERLVKSSFYRMISRYSPVGIGKQPEEQSASAAAAKEEHYPREQMAVYERILRRIASFSEIDFAISYLRKGFRESCFYWELVIMLRKIIILCVIEYQPDVVMACIFIVLTLIIFGVFHMIARPFVRLGDNISEILSLLACAWLSIAVVFHEMYTTDNESYWRDFVFVFVVVLSLVVPIFALMFKSVVMEKNKLSFRIPPRWKDEDSDEEDDDEEDESREMIHRKRVVEESENESEEEEESSKESESDESESDESESDESELESESEGDVESESSEVEEESVGDSVAVDASEDEEEEITTIASLTTLAGNEE